MQRLGGFKIVLISCEGNALVIDVALKPTNVLQSADVQLSAPLGSPGTSDGRVASKNRAGSGWDHSMYDTDIWLGEGNWTLIC